MDHHRSDEEIIQSTHNSSRYCTQYRQISLVLMVAVILWGVYGYMNMSKRKDPDIPSRHAMLLCFWPGVSADKVEALVTRKIEEKIAQNSKVKKIDSNTREGIASVVIELVETIKEPGKEFDDIKLKLDSITDLPEGAGPIMFMKDFGDTAALMLTVASPKADPLEVELRARSIKAALAQAREGVPLAPGRQRVSLVHVFPLSIDSSTVGRLFNLFAQDVQKDGIMSDIRLVNKPGFFAIDGSATKTDKELLAYIAQFIHSRLQANEFHPDGWMPALIRDLGQTQSILAKAAGDKYSYRELDKFTDLIQKTIKTFPIVSKVNRSGILKEQIYLYYSQRKLASYGMQASGLKDLLSARNITFPGGKIDVDGKNVSLDPTGAFKNEKEIGNVVVGISETGTPVYLRDVVEISRDYESPPGFLNFYTWRDDKGAWHRSRAITIAAEMKQGEQIGSFGEAIDEALKIVKPQLPDDLIIARTSDQPLQVKEQVDLFMGSLYEAIILVIVVALIGFWAWRPALLFAISIPLTLAMTFGMMHLLAIDLQQVSIGSLIIALGLLVDDPVVAGDAIQRELDHGRPALVASWLGPTKLATAILYATITNVVAYLPFMLIRGDMGKFLFSLSVVMTCSLIASRIVSMTFIPTLGYYILKPSTKKQPTIEELRTKGFFGLYYRVGTVAYNHRWKVLIGSLGVLALGVVLMMNLKTMFMPKDLAYLSYVDVWLPLGSPLASTDMVAAKTEEVIRKEADRFGKEHPDKDGKPAQVLQSLTTFEGGGGPRFWFSVSPEQEQLHYAQIIIQVTDKHYTNDLVGPLQEAIAREVPGAQIDVRQLDSGSSVGVPVQISISGQDIPTLRKYAQEVKDIFNSLPNARKARDDWNDEIFSVRLKIDPDRANLAGVTNMDIASSSASGMSGLTVGTLREGDKQIPIVTRLRMEERATLSDLGNLYVYSSQGKQKVPLSQVSSLEYTMKTEQIIRKDQFRVISVNTFPLAGTLPSEVMNLARPRLEAIEKTLPPGYKMEIGGEEKEQKKGFDDLGIVMAISISAIFMALLFQFKNAIKPFLVFAAVPYGMVGALAMLFIMDSPFGFMAFLGIASLVGVIVSHIIVFFDFIEEMHAKGEPLKEALLDSGIVRLRPVLITVGATVIALVPLAINGGPMWEPLCYAQIGGLLLSTVITLLLVPTLYAVSVLDLKIIQWERVEEEEMMKVQEASGGKLL